MLLSTRRAGGSSYPAPPTASSSSSAPEPQLRPQLGPSGGHPSVVLADDAADASTRCLGSERPLAALGLCPRREAWGAHGSSWGVICVGAFAHPAADAAPYTIANGETGGPSSSRCRPLRHGSRSSAVDQVCQRSATGATPLVAGEERSGQRSVAIGMGASASERCAEDAGRPPMGVSEVWQRHWTRRNRLQAVPHRDRASGTPLELPSRRLSPRAVALAAGRQGPPGPSDRTSDPLGAA
jgi:hypothetical protein